MTRLGEMAESPGTVYIAGGTTAVLLGMRNQTVDIDLKLDPEPRGAFAAIAKLKEQLQINVKLASPDQFVPALPGWQDHSEHITTVQMVEFKHFDYYTQALSKIERGYDQDLADARSFVNAGLIEPGTLVKLFESVRGDLDRYPAIDSDSLYQKVHEFAEEFTNS